MSNSLDPDQAHHSVWPDLDPNCLQNQHTAKVVTSKERPGQESIFKKLKNGAIYIVDVQTGINVINLLSCTLNSTEYGIYPAHIVKMHATIVGILTFVCRINKTSDDV